MTDQLAARLAADVRAARDELPAPSMVLFSGPARDPQAAEAREALAMQVATASGLLPWPDWSVVRHGSGRGAHLLSVIDQLGETGRAAGVVVCLLAPLAASVVDHARTVAARRGLAIAVVGEVP